MLGDSKASPEACLEHRSQAGGDGLENTPTRQGKVTSNQTPSVASVREAKRFGIC